MVSLEKWCNKFENIKWEEILNNVENRIIDKILLIEFWGDYLSVNYLKIDDYVKMKLKFVKSLKSDGVFVYK